MRNFNFRREWWAIFLSAWCWQFAPLLLAGDKLTLHLVYTSDTIGYVDACG